MTSDTIERAMVLLDETTNRLTALRHARSAFEDRLAPDFNTFDFIAQDELMLSRLLGWLLNPKGGHGQGDRFLKAFVQAVLPDLAGFDASLARVDLEAPCGDRRRIDILVRSGRAAFAIENKPYAADQAGQLEHYLRHLEIFDDGRLIYLTGAANRLPSEGSLSETCRRDGVARGQLVILSFAELQPWLTACVGLAASERVRTFIDDFQRLILKRFEGAQDMTEQVLLTELMTGDARRVEAAARIALGWRDAQKQLIERFNTDIRAALPAAWIITDTLSAARYSQVNVARPDAPGVQFRLIFDARNYNEFAFGIVKPKAIKADRQRIWDRIADTEFGPGHKEAPVDEWAWWEYATATNTHVPVSAYWETSAEPWVAVADGSLATRIAAAAHRMLAIATTG